MRYVIYLTATGYYYGDMADPQNYEHPETPIGFPPTKYLSTVCLSSFINPDCGKLVSMMTKLQEVVMTLGQDALFKFPQIVVVGDQSSGKTSVLESLVGKTFLPRGLGTVTRRPLLIRLEAITSGNEEGEGKPKDKVVFQHTDHIFTDFNQVMREIEEETVRIAGNNKGICPEPICMTIYSMNAVSNLTLVDLPGLIKVPMGDQPENIEIMVRDLIIRYVSNPNSIILAVITANTDIATNESLKIAKEVDQNGERTIVVVTKLDLMDPGTDALDLLSGNIIPINLGIIGVVNRSQKDIMQGKSLKASAFEEMNFFYKNYSNIAHKNGRTYLGKCLQNVLINYIQKYLPTIKSKIDTALSLHNNHLKILQGPSLKSLNESLLQMITNFANSYSSQVRGQHTELDTQELKGGARISYIFQEVFGSALKSVNALEGYSKNTILTAVRNSAGAKPCIFVPESCFELLLKREIVRLEAPALRCVQLVYVEMEKILYSCTKNSNIDMLRYPKLSKKIIEVSLRLLKSRMAETINLVENIIAIHGAYINTAHPDFCNYRMSETQLVPINEETEDLPLVSLIEKLMITYFNIVKKEVQDMVPKAIMHCFVNYVLEHIHSELVSNLYNVGTESQELLEESITIYEQRKNTLRMIEALEKANNIVSEIREGYFPS